MALKSELEMGIPSRMYRGGGTGVDGVCTADGERSGDAGFTGVGHDGQTGDLSLEGLVEGGRRS